MKMNGFIKLTPVFNDCMHTIYTAYAEAAKRKKILIIFLTILCLAAVTVLVAVKGFDLDKVKVSGNELYSDKQIRESVLNDEYSWNSLYVVLKYRLFKMKEIPFIDEMELSMLYPHTIKIKVK